MEYRPNPLDTTGVRLPPEVLALAELLAKNTHDIWAKARMEEGWTCGPARSDADRTNPCLVPYEELPDSEKEYDRRINQELLAALYALGYRVVRDGAPGAPSEDE